nr:hypothetical protein [Frigidibacter mobilis]
MGDEAYVSPEGQKDRSPTLRQLNHEEAVEIPAGQFAFLLTREFVTVPHDLIAFINMKNGLKSSGLVNVSGFHVDPGYKGRLVFAVFNAGPKKITVRQNDDAFLIWFARLEGATEKHARKKAGFNKIESELIARVPEESASLNSLTARIERMEKQLSWRRTAIIYIAGIISAVLAGLIVR